MNSLCILPFYNEENRINKIEFNKIFFENKSIDFLLLNDGSTDKTLEILNDFKNKFDNIFIYSSYKNLGKAEIIRRAFLLPTNSDYKFIGFLDSDFATPFEEYKNLLNIIKIKDFDIIFGSRVRLHGYDIKRNEKRHFFSRIIISFLNIIFRLNIYDTQCGCKIFNNKSVKDIFSKKFTTKWLFDVEIFIRYFGLVKNKNAYEFPINKWTEIKGSKIKTIDFFLVPYNILKLIYVYKIKRNRFFKN
jgi:dolichyl-phosphate beta-glucosyltransferase